MIRPVLAAALVLLAPAAWGQDAGHVLAIRDGAVLLDGRVLPQAAPSSLDLLGLEVEIEYSGPVTPVISIDGQPYVFEGERLVPFEESSRVGERIYGLGEPVVDPSSMTEARLVKMGEAAYLQRVAEQDQALHSQIEREQALEADAFQRAGQIRRMAPGPARDAAREALRALLSDLLQLKDSNRREELARARERIRAIESQLDERASMHDEIVDARLQALCGD